jgi:prevent-host-death family protein
MQTFTIAQAKNQLSSLVHTVEQGEQVVLTRHGKPVVRLVAAKLESSQPDISLREAQVLAELQSASLKLRSKINFSDWINLRDEGRKY